MGTLQIELVSTSIRATNLQNQIMPPNTRSQVLKMIEDKVDESITTVNRDHDQKYDKVVKLLEVYEQ
jgi:hypothetical protein